MLRRVDSQKSRTVISALIAALLAFLAFPSVLDYALDAVPKGREAWLSLDPSWHMALAKASTGGWTWGEDIIFTYGPLHFLATRIAPGVEAWHFLIFDLFIAVNGFYIFFYLLTTSGTAWLTRLVLITSVLLLPVFVGSGMAIVLFAFLIFWIRRSLDEPGVLFLAMQIALVCIMFFTKLNTGLFAAVFFYAALFYRLITGTHSRIRDISAALLLPVVIMILSSLLNVHLGGYLRGGYEVVKGYGEVMQLEEGYINEFRFSYIAILAGLVVLGARFWFFPQEWKKTIMLLFLFGGAAFILHKQGFTRMDTQHMTEFYKYLLLFVIVIPEMHHTTHRIVAPAIITVLFICIFFAKRREAYLFNFRAKLDKSEYLSRLNNFSDTSLIRLYPPSEPFPAEILSRVGQHPVDVIPWNVIAIAENRLNYRPRPVFQSYSAYTPYLARVNFDFYNDTVTCPRFVFYQLQTIDGRYGLFDEPLLQLALRKNFNCPDTFRYDNHLVLLFERKEHFEPVRLEESGSREVALEDIITPEANHLYTLEADKNIGGKIRAFVAQPPVLQLKVHFAGGEQVFKTSPPLMRTGIFGKQLVTSTADAYKMFCDTAGVLSSVVGYSIGGEQKKWFRDKVKLTEYIIQ